MALFSKKHYHELKLTLRKMVHDAPDGSEIRAVVDEHVSTVADMLERDNPAFERQRFITEIYVPEHRSQEP